jgi:RNA polymerase sigma factor (TIGR02999 family)
MAGPDHHPDSPPRAALTDTFYAELRAVADAMMRRERTGHTLQPTAVANEACLRLAAQGLPDLPRDQQLAIAARVLEQVLIDHARRHNARKRGGGRGATFRVRLEHLETADPDAQPDAGLDFEAVHAALRRLRDLHPRQAEVVTLRVMGGLTMAQIGALLGVSTRTAESDWAVARAWLRRTLDRAPP